MNKKTIFFLISLILIFGCFVLPAFATDGESASDIKSIYDSSEINEVLKAIGDDALINKYEASQKSSVQNASSENLSPYKLYSISPLEFSDINSEVVKNIIASEDYRWIVPNDTSQVITVGKNGNKWKVLGYSTSESDLESAEAVLGESVNGILKTSQNEGDSKIQGVNSTEEYLCFEVPQYHTYFLGMFSESESYVIPYSSRPDLTGLENGKKYSAEAAEKILSASFNISEANYNTANENGGGTGSKITLGNTLWLLSIPAAALVVFLLILFLKRKQHINNSNT